MFKGKSWIAKLSELYQSDGRRHARLPADFSATITGSFGTIAVTGLDANRGGVGVRSAQPLPLGTLVFLRIGDLGLMGFAHVRHCSGNGDAYLLGLQFREALTRGREEVAGFSWQRMSQAGHRLWDEAEA